VFYNFFRWFTNCNRLNDLETFLVVFSVNEYLISALLNFDWEGQLILASSVCSYSFIIISAIFSQLDVFINFFVATLSVLKWKVLSIWSKNEVIVIEIFKIYLRSGFTINQCVACFVIKNWESYRRRYLIWKKCGAW